MVFFVRPREYTYAHVDRLHTIIYIRSRIIQIFYRFYIYIRTVLTIFLYALRHTLCKIQKCTIQSYWSEWKTWKTVFKGVNKDAFNESGQKIGSVFFLPYNDQLYEIYLE